MKPPLLPSPAARRRAARLTSILLFLPFFLSLATPAAALRVMTYNVLNYPTSLGDSREDEFRAVVDAIAPDVLIVQEITSGSGPNEFLNDVLNTLEPGQWALAPFVDGQDTDNACFYRTSSLDLLSHVVLNNPTLVRDIDGWKFRADGYTAADAEFSLYSLHLKASQGFDEEQQRLAEAQILRTHLTGLPAGSNFIVGGDFNIYRASEPAWTKLTGSEANDDGRVFDPISRVGNWHNNSSFADVHTQSPRVTQFGGGANGGMDDRFDMLLVNDDANDGAGFDYVPGSYTTYGQDGLHFNNAINAPPTNAAVGQTMANILHDASDHLPVFFDVQLPAILLAQGSLDFGQVLVGASMQLLLTVQNAAAAPAADLDYSLTADAGFGVAPGPTTLAAGASDFQVVTLDTSTPGVKSGNVQISHDAAEPASPQTFAASAVVFSASEPSLDGGTVVVSGEVDFGEQPLGQFTPIDVDVYNLASVFPAAPLEVTEAQITGTDAARLSVPGFSPTLVGVTPATFGIAFDDVGASEGVTYSATLIFKTRDETSIVGWLDRADLVLTLEATVANTGTATPGTLVLATRLHRNEPNPFNPITTIRFDLARAGRVELSVYNAQGRVVRVLESGSLESGEHRRIWDGRSHDGRAVASGVYFYRLVTAEGEQTRRMVLVR